MSENPDIGFVAIRLGPALIDVPDGWEVCEDGSRGVIVLRLPLDLNHGTHQLSETPGLIHPNIALRFFDGAPAEGGVARAAADELRAVLSAASGTTPVAAQPFLTDSGLPGRGHLLVGLHARIPFQMSRWYVGVGSTLVEVVLTFPNTDHPELLMLGEAVARSIRADPTGVEHGAAGSGSAPAIPEWRVDSTLLRALKAADLPTELARLERLEQLTSEATLGTLPGRGAELSHEAMQHLLAITELGSIHRFSAAPEPALGELEALGLVEDQRLSARGRHVMSGVSGTPDISVAGRLGEETTEARIWLDGDEATCLLGPSHRDLVEGRVGHGYVLRELAVSASVILDAWVGNHAAWFSDFSVVLDEAALNGCLEGDPQRGIPALGGAKEALVREALSGGLSDWTFSGHRSGHQFRWLRTRHRGPMLIDSEEGAPAVRLSSSSGSVIHHELMTRVVEESRAERVPHLG